MSWPLLSLSLFRVYSLLMNWVLWAESNCRPTIALTSPVHGVSEGGSHNYYKTMQIRNELICSYCNLKRERGEKRRATGYRKERCLCRTPSMCFPGFLTLCWRERRPSYFINITGCMESSKNSTILMFVKSKSH